MNVKGDASIGLKPIIFGIVAVLVLFFVLFATGGGFGNTIYDFVRNLGFSSEKTPLGEERIVGYSLEDGLIYVYTGTEWIKVDDDIEFGRDKYDWSEIKDALVRFYVSPRKGPDKFWTGDYRLFYVDDITKNLRGDGTLFTSIGVEDKLANPYVGEPEERMFRLNYDNTIFAERVKFNFEKDIKGNYDSGEYSSAINKIIEWRDQIFEGGKYEKFVSIGGKNYKVRKVNPYIFVDLKDPTSESIDRYNSVEEERFDDRSSWTNPSRVVISFLQDSDGDKPAKIIWNPYGDGGWFYQEGVVDEFCEEFVTDDELVPLGLQAPLDYRICEGKQDDFYECLYTLTRDDQGFSDLNNDEKMRVCVFDIFSSSIGEDINVPGLNSDGEVSDEDMFLDAVLLAYNEKARPGYSPYGLDLISADYSSVDKETMRLFFNGFPLPIQIYRSSSSGNEIIQWGQFLPRKSTEEYDFLLVQGAVGNVVNDVIEISYSEEGILSDLSEDFSKLKAHFDAINGMNIDSLLDNEGYLKRYGKESRLLMDSSKEGLINRFNLKVSEDGTYYTSEGDNGKYYFIGVNNLFYDGLGKERSKILSNDKYESSEWWSMEYMTLVDLSQEVFSLSLWRRRHLCHFEDDALRLICVDTLSGKPIISEYGRRSPSYTRWDSFGSFGSIGVEIEYNSPSMKKVFVWDGIRWINRIGGGFGYEGDIGEFYNGFSVVVKELVGGFLNLKEEIREIRFKNLQSGEYVTVLNDFESYYEYSGDKRYINKSSSDEFRYKFLKTYIRKMKEVEPGYLSWIPDDFWN